MNIRIEGIVLYSHSGQTRELLFPKNGLNIITGASKTGKSAIIDILDYCLGRGKCNVAEGKVRQNVSWFGVKLKNQDGELFVARRNPGPGIETSPDIFIERGSNISLPDLDELSKNITLDSLIRLITRFSGIAENEHRPLTGTRRPLQATVRHALFFCFQKQYEIANQQHLFHRQGEDFIPLAIKDTLPYFIGAIDENHFLKQNELDTARDELRKLEQRASQEETSKDASFPRVRRLITEAKRVGIIDEGFEPIDLDLTLASLERASKIEAYDVQYIPDFGDSINRIQAEHQNLQILLSDTKEEIRAVRLFLSDQSGFAREGSEQHARLTSVGLYKATDSDGHNCPVCDSTLETPTPQLDQLERSLAQLDEQLSAIRRENPHLQERLDELEKRKTKLENDLRENQATLTRAITEDEKAKVQHDLIVGRARVIGRISSFLESLRPAEEEADFETLIKQARARVEAFERELNPDEIAQRVDTFLNLISTRMSEYSSSLDLEHSGSALRLDIKNLTVVADTEDGPVPLTRMGSGENWVGYHVLTHLALHWWFRHKNRPVPGFLIFDQPSQAHYPPERDQEGKLDPLTDKDRVAVHDLFELMHKIGGEIEGDFQLIVLDHAHIDEDWFEDAIVEEWRHGTALVPEEWYE